MNWVTVLTCLVLFTTTLVQADENNEIDETRPIRIDPILRKALLKALSTLEKESEEEKLAGVATATTTSASVIADSTKSNDEILEESTGADQASVQFHSFVAQPQKSGTDNDEIIKTVVVSAPHVTLMPPQFDPIKNNDGIKIETIQLARSVSTSVNANDADDMTKKLAESKPTPPKPRRITTTTTSTTTTPAPIHNEDGENIEKVNQNDVQIYQAPLVSAFTIQQDEFGMPRNVIPLYKPVNSVPAFAQRNNFTPPQQVQQLPQSQVQAQASTVSQIVPSQQLFPGFFDQRNRELEQQVFLLQNQNRQQEALLNRQRYLEEQRQNQIVFEQRLRSEEENRVRAQRLQVQQQQQQQVAQQQLRLLPPQQSNNVQFVPSISLNPIQSSISVEQQLPIREPANFLAKTPQASQFTNSIQPLKTLQPPVLPTVQELPVKPFQNFFNSGSNNIIPVPENLPQLPLTTRNRVFRQESGTANFARQTFQPSHQPQSSFQNFQPQQQNFQPQQQAFQPQQQQQSFQPQQQQQQSFQPQQQQQQQSFQPQQQKQNFQKHQQQQQNYNLNRQFANSQLQNLLFQSGITPGGGRPQEELNIIAKVLSLNHGIQQPQNNFIDEPRRFVRHASYFYF